MLLGSAWAAGVYIGNWGHRGHRGHKWTVADLIKMGLVAFPSGPPQGWPTAGSPDPFKSVCAKIFNHVRREDGF